MAPDNSHENHVFTVGDRGFSHYVMAWGEVTTEPDSEGWFYVRFDNGESHMLNAVRFVTPEVAKNYGYR